MKPILSCTIHRTELFARPSSTSYFRNENLLAHADVQHNSIKAVDTCNLPHFTISVSLT
ncbi:hypothetical protein [Alistipes senegalensis]|uniref:hypothetical protein n=1 Tax=Alistipes senegalensis TaxID=1288121 RepID=UPI00242C15A3|nr:hypothetical protein [Alistipes senegalensis]